MSSPPAHRPPTRPAPADPVRVDRALRAEADRLLADGLRAALASYGAVHLVGSYRMRLMAWRDLDIHVVPDVLDRGAFFELGGRLAELLRPERMHYRDETLARSRGLPAGLYWGVYLGAPARGGWKLDVWATDDRGLERVDSYCSRIERRLTARSRRIILKLKGELWHSPEYRRSFGSSDIYEAVLEHAIESGDAFRAYLDRRAC